MLSVSKHDGSAALEPPYPAQKNSTGADAPSPHAGVYEKGKRKEGTKERGNEIKNERRKRGKEGTKEREERKEGKSERRNEGTRDQGKEGQRE